MHRLSQNGATPEAPVLRRLQGKLAYLRMLNAHAAAPLIAAFVRLRGTPEST
jgi:hypothetical protein